MELLYNVEKGLERLAKFRRVYLATPYSKCVNLNDAAEEAAYLAGTLLKHNINCYSPIVHSHHLAQAAQINPYGNEFWAAIDEPWREICDTLLVGKLAGWYESRGIRHEFDLFLKETKPIFFINPYTLIIDASAEPKWEAM